VKALGLLPKRSLEAPEGVGGENGNVGGREYGVEQCIGGRQAAGRQTAPISV